MSFKDLEVHDKWFTSTELDPVWLTDIGRRNWRAFTSDQELPSLHRDAIIKAEVGVFILPELKRGEKYTKWVEMVRSCKDRITHAAAMAERPFIARISRNGRLYKIERLRPHGKDEDITVEIAGQAAGLGITEL